MADKGKGKEKSNSASWHHARGKFKQVEVIEDYADKKDLPRGVVILDPVTIKVDGKTRMVPAHQLYDYDRPRRSMTAEDEAKAKQDANAAAQPVEAMPGIRVTDTSRTITAPG